jgi:tetratricopeptide (TPR) repeat protein
VRDRSHVLSALTLVLLTATAVAQSPAATKLFEEGRDLAKQAKWAEACDRFSKSLALDPAPGTKLNLGDCLEKQGKVRAGWILFEEAARDFDRTNDSRAKFAHDRAAAAAGKLATLVVKVTESSRAGLAVRIGDRAATPQPEIVERVDPGSLTVTVTAPGKPPFTTTVTATAGKTAVVDVPSFTEPAAPPPSTGQIDEPDGRRKRVRIAIGLGAAGGVALITSGIFGILAKSQYDGAFDDGECAKQGGMNVCSPDGKSAVDSAGTKADIGTGLLIGGAALGVAAVVVYLTAPKERGISIAPMASSTTAGVMLGGRF